MTRVAIIGAGRGGTALIELLHKDPLVTIVGVADLQADAPGMDLARRLNIPTTADFRTLLKQPLDIVVDVTGNDKVKAALESLRAKGVELIGGLSARLMWQLIDERIRSKALEDEVRSRYAFDHIIAQDREMQLLLKQLPEVARTKSTVLVQGETGTGKELVAHAIHHLSPRADKPFIKVNCPALAEGVLESELFGHVKGAFTGAVMHKIGRFELANGGTIFLDEIGELSAATQVKLLRVLQEGEFERVGESRRRTIDVRVIAATNRDLKHAIEAGGFRQDLYYRLSVVPLRLPPLRERRGDIPPLAHHFLQKYVGEAGKHINAISPEALELLCQYDYPGNIRELENIMELAVVRCQGETILPGDLAGDVRQKGLVGKAIDGADPCSDLEKELIVTVLGQTGWRYSEAANRLKMSRTTLWRRLRQYRIEPPGKS
ncbi:MAG: sigma 54-interacting transcriptional regulator [Nitrospirae bacterium]|nr:sigma 54-interacting transcriptional regulator [Nitrospirota bacterium]